MNAVEEKITAALEFADAAERMNGGPTKETELIREGYAMLRLAVEQRDKFAELHYGEHWKSKGIQSFMRLSQDAALIAAAQETVAP